MFKKKSIVPQLIYVFLTLSLTVIGVMFFLNYFNENKSEISEKEKLLKESINDVKFFVDDTKYIPFLSFDISFSKLGNINGITDYDLSTNTIVIFWNGLIYDEPILRILKYRGKLIVSDGSDQTNNVDLLDLLKIKDYFWFKFDVVSSEKIEKRIRDFRKLIDLKDYSPVVLLTSSFRGVDNLTLVYSSVDNGDFYKFVYLDKPYLLILKNTLDKVVIINLDNKSYQECPITLLTEVKCNSINFSLLDNVSKDFSISKKVFDKELTKEYYFSSQFNTNGNIKISDRGLVLFNNRYLLGVRNMYDIKDKIQRFNFGYIKYDSTNDKLLVMIKIAPISYSIKTEDKDIYYLQRDDTPYLLSMYLKK